MYTFSLNKHQLLKKSVLTLLILTLLFTSFMEVSAKKKLTWRDLIYDMEDLLNEAVKIYEDSGDGDKAVDKVNEAYFGYYEKRGIEKTVMSRISGKRASTVEYHFSKVKKNMKKGTDAATVRGDMDVLITMLLEDAYILDGLVYDPATHTRETDVQSEDPSSEGDAKADVSEGDRWASFGNSLIIILREGVEAILIVAAIIAYLVKTGHKDKLKHIYLGVVLALLCSVLMAVVLNVASSYFSDQVSGRAQEIFEGITMLIAVVVLFQVSNWLLSKSEAEKWDEYIKGKLDTSVSKDNMFSLMFVSFLAVFREGAETILFYQALIISPGNDINMMFLGLFVGILILIVIYLLMRFYSVKLPLKQFFTYTSVLLYIMAISFVGNAVFEFQEADVISVTLIEGFPTIDIYGFRPLELLGVHPMVENLTAQFVMIVLTIVSVIYLKRKNVVKS